MRLCLGVGVISCNSVIVILHSYMNYEQRYLLPKSEDICACFAENGTLTSTFVFSHQKLPHMTVLKAMHARSGGQLEVMGILQGM